MFSFVCFRYRPREGWERIGLCLGHTRLYLTLSFVCLDHPHLLFNYWMSGFITFVFATRTYIESREFLALTIIREFLIQIFLA